MKFTDHPGGHDARQGAITGWYAGKDLFKGTKRDPYRQPRCLQRAASMSDTSTRLITIIGAPAAGKSTLTRHVSSQIGATVFRLREFAEQYRLAHPAAAAAFVTNDPLSWLPETTVATLLGAAFHAPPATPLVLLENLPGTAGQLEMLLERAAVIGSFLEVVLLTAPDSVLSARTRSRRVCPTCEPDPRGDPHQPAEPAPDDPNQCRQCCGRLAARRSDEPRLFEARLRRFRDHLPAIRTAAADQQVAWHSVDATAKISDVTAVLLDVCRLTPTPTR